MKKIDKALVMFLALVMVISILPVRADAATKVKLNKTQTTIYVGGSTTIQIQGTKKSAKWSTSNSKIATVTSKGKVTGKKNGTATITAKIGQKSYKCIVTVKNPYLNSSKKTLTVGETFTLKITGTTAKAWSSNDNEVATVNSKGKVTAIQAGTATITCTGTNEKKYKCIIVVNYKQHEHVYEEHIIEPTCTEIGFIKYICSCGSLEYQEVIPATGHQYDDGIIVQEATDSSAGIMEYTCKVCGEVTKAEYGKEQIFSHEIAEQPATLCGYWDASEANKIWNSVNEYRKSKGLSELTFKEEYDKYAMNQTMASYFGIGDIAVLTESGKRPAYICGIAQAACDGSSFFEHYIVRPGNDGITNISLFERDDIEMGIRVFVEIKYRDPKSDTYSSVFTSNHTQQCKFYYIAVCLYS